MDGNDSYQMVKFKEITDSGRDEVIGNKDENELLQTQKFYGSFSSLIKLSEAYYIAAECLGTTGSEVYNLPAAWGYLNRMFLDRGNYNWGSGNAEVYLQDWLRNISVNLSVKVRSSFISNGAIWDLIMIITVRKK